MIVNRDDILTQFLMLYAKALVCNARELHQLNNKKRKGGNREQWQLICRCIWLLAIVILLNITVYSINILIHSFDDYSCAFVTN